MIYQILVKHPAEPMIYSDCHEFEQARDVYNSFRRGFAFPHEVQVLERNENLQGSRDITNYFTGQPTEYGRATAVDELFVTAGQMEIIHR